MLIVGSVSRDVSLTLDGWSRVNWSMMLPSVWDVGFVFLVALQWLSLWWTVSNNES